ncbi:MAG: FecR domain-containing protein [Planctomycetes bacterium]|nr:FecR domain-containing protein [Planctomycetota bacterium]
MTPTPCQDVDRALWRYIDREISASDLAAISSHLKECARCRDLYHERSREASRYRMAFLGSPFGPKFMARFRQRAAEEGLYSAEAAPPGHRRRGPKGDRASGGEVGAWDSPTFSRRRIYRIATVAAMVLLIPLAVIVGIFFHGSPPAALGDFTAEGGPVGVSRIDAAEGLEPRSTRARRGDIFPGSLIRVADGATAFLRLAAPRPGPDSTVSLEGPAQLLIEAGATRRRLSARLEQGTLTATVTRLGSGELFSVTTPHARSTVMGTVFKLKVLDGRTVLSVLEGKVRFQALRGLPGQGSVDVTDAAGAFEVAEGESAPGPVAAAPAAARSDAAGRGEAAARSPAAEVGQGGPEGPVDPAAPAATVDPAPDAGDDAPAGPPSRPDLDGPVDGKSL